MKRIGIGLLILVGTWQLGVGQDKKSTIQPYLAYQGFFDNREFFQLGLQPSTYFGQRISPGFTTQLDSTNKLIVSINFLQEFGNPRLISSWQPEVFFQHTTKKIQFVFGAFPREKWADTLALAIFSDSLRYTRPNATGFSLKNQRKTGHSSLWLDWSGQKTALLREQFFIGTAHQGLWKGIAWQVEGGLTHIAKSSQPTPEQFIEEQVAWLMQLGKDFHQKENLFKFRLGWLQSWERIRNGTTIQSPTSLWILGSYQYRRWDVQHTRKHGQSHRLAMGDPFYQFENYHRTDLRYTWGQRGKWKVEGIYSLHCANQVWSHQQRLLIRFDW